MFPEVRPASVWPGEHSGFLKLKVEEISVEISNDRESGENDSRLFKESCVASTSDRAKETVSASASSASNCQCTSDGSSGRELVVLENVTLSHVGLVPGAVVECGWTTTEEPDPICEFVEVVLTDSIELLVTEAKGLEEELAKSMFAVETAGPAEDDKTGLRFAQEKLLFSDSCPLSTRDNFRHLKEPLSEPQLEVRSSSRELNEYLRSKPLSSSSFNEVRLLKLSRVFEGDSFKLLRSESSNMLPKNRCFEM